MGIQAAQSEAMSIMSNRLVGLMLAAFLFLMIDGCGKLGEFNQPDPEEVLRKYLDALIGNHDEEAYGYLSTEDRTVKGLDEYKSDASALIKNNVSYKIHKNNKARSGGTARLNVEITSPDMEAIFRETMGTALEAALDSKDKNQIYNAVSRRYGASVVPVKTNNEVFDLVKEKEGWKVFFGWKAQKEAKAKEEKAAREREEKIAALLSDAKQLRKSKNLSGAIQKYEAALALNEGAVEAREAINEVKAEMRYMEEKQDYLSKVELRNLHVAEGRKTSASRLESGVFGTIVNNGDKTLKEVELTVYYLDNNGVTVGEENYRLLSEPEQSCRGYHPFRPKYVKDFGYAVKDSAPSVWAKKIEGKITNIEFLD